MKIFVCRICGEVYLGKDISPSCPFCGVENKFLVSAEEWRDENNIELTEVSRSNLKKALDLELSNTAFYECIVKTISNQELAKMFKGLFKVEREHASIYKKILKMEQVPEIKEVCVDDIEKCLEESFFRENKAVAFYKKAIDEATEPRVKEVFTAIMNVEKDHIALDSEMKEKFKE
ncbi:MAG: ferritin family protein [Candidatus Falkowbacteria bacterium]